MEERTTVESPPVERLMADERPLGSKPRHAGAHAGQDDRATLEVAAMGGGASWGRGAPHGQVPQVPQVPQHAPIDADEEEPTVEAGKRILGYRREGTLDEPTIDRVGRAGPGRPRQPGRPPYNPPAPLGAARAKLVVIAGNDNGREFPLTGQPITIGRALDNNVVLSDIAVSRKHLSLEFDGQRYVLVDHGSGNGTMINNRLETGTCTLTDGDRLELGNTVFRFEHPSTRGLAAVQPVAPVPAGSGFGDEQSTVVGRSKSRQKIEPRPGLAAPAQPPAPQPAVAPQPAHRPVLPVPGPQGAFPDSDRSRPLPGVAAASSNAAAARPEAPLPGVGPAPAPMAEIAPAQAPVRGDPSQLMGGNAFPGQLAPHEHLMSTAPVPRFAPFAQPTKSRRGLVIGLLLATVLVLGGAIGVVLWRGQGWPLRQLDDTTAGTQPDDETVAGAPGEKTPADPLPVSTWGTRETVMLASIGATEAPAKEPEEKEDAPVEDEPDTTEKVDPAGGAEGAEATDQAETQATDIEPPTEQVDPGEQETTDKTDNKPRRITSKPVRRATRPNTGAQRKRALAQYRSKDFDGAAQTLRAAAGEASASEAGELRTLASTFEKVGASMSKGNANYSRDPVDAMNAYRSALSLDRKHGGGAHSSFIRSKLSVVAPKAAAAYMAKSKYEAAKSAADTAAANDAGDSAMVQRVRQGLERKAGEFYKSALRMKKEPAKANKLLKRILKMVPPDSSWYSKAYKRLNTR